MPSILGLNSVGADGDYTTAKGVTCRFQASEAGRAIAVLAHIRSTGTANFKFIVHNNNSGQPDALIGQTNGGVFNTTYAWYQLPLITPFDFANGDTLHPGLISDDFIIIPYNNGGTTGQFKEILPEFAYPTPTDPANVNTGAEFDVIASIAIVYLTQAEMGVRQLTKSLRPGMFKPGIAR